VRRLVILDAVPIGEALARCDARFAAAWWHWFFLGQTDKPAGRILREPVGTGSPRVRASDHGGTMPDPTQRYRFEWRAEFSNEALNALHAEAFDHAVQDHDWLAQVRTHSLGWVCAFDADTLLGFVNVPWDGALHAFIIDPVVLKRYERQGVGTVLVALAAEHARAAGCTWLHVDFDEPLRGFYFDACGFTPTIAGLIDLTARAPIARTTAPS